MFYQKVIKPIFFKFNPEFVHNFMCFFGEMLGKTALTRKFVASLALYKGRDISKVVDGIKYKTPFLLSAGFDYNGNLVNILPQISFGGEEVGSVTARPCEGNKKPRLTRLPKSKSIIVYKGLKNEGVERVMNRLKKYPKTDFVVGVSIARTNDEKTCNDEEGTEDFFYSFKRLNEENVGDYYTINISCPNVFGGETFAESKRLEMLMEKLVTIKCDKPVYVKMPINLSWLEFDALLKILNKYKMIKGVIIGNLNKNYDDLDFREEAPKEYRGGLSGKPCFKLSNELIRKTREVYGKRFTIIGVGGVMLPQDMIEKFEAGSDLVMLITGMIYNGPLFIKSLCEEYEKIYK